MSNPFKRITDNAEKSKNVIHDKGRRGKAISHSRQCDNCGAPRPKGSNLIKCQYCRTPFMDITEHIKTDD